MAAQAGKPSALPVNPMATTAARLLLRQLDTISGGATLSGQHNFPNLVSRYSDRVYDLTGKYPALFGQDFGFSGGEDKDSTLGRASMIEEVTRQYRAGAVIALTWHAVRPVDDEPVTFHDSVQGHLTEWEWKQLLTPGTDLNLRWARQVDVIAGYLRELQAAGVPVLFRPYHEMNGNWFWWGGRPGPDGSAALYRQLYNRFVHLHHLDNLIWVWNVNSPGGNAGSVADYYPGEGYADLITMDIYGTFEQQYYDSMIKLAGEKRPIALAEVGAMPTLKILAAQPRWTYFMMWSGLAEASNTSQQLATMFHASNVIDRGDPRLPLPAEQAAIVSIPVAPNATKAARAQLARLYDVAPASVLSGQQATLVANELVSPRKPVISEFTVMGTEGAPLLQAIRDAAKARQLVLLRYAPPRPTDGTGTGALTDYEWKQLLTPDTDLNKRWQAQAASASRLLKQLAQEKIAVLWSPYPQSNASKDKYWWAGRPGAEGSTSLVRMLYQALSYAENGNNLVWMWEPAAPGFGPGGNGALADYDPGVLYADVLTIDVDILIAGRFHMDRMLQHFAGARPVGVRVASGIPAPAIIDEQTAWRWVILPPDTSSDSAPLTDFYADPRVVSQ